MKHAYVIRTSTRVTAALTLEHAQSPVAPDALDAVSQPPGAVAMKAQIMTINCVRCGRSVTYNYRGRERIYCDDDLRIVRQENARALSSSRRGRRRAPLADPNVTISALTSAIAEAQLLLIGGSAQRAYERLLRTGVRPLTPNLLRQRRHDDSADAFPERRSAGSRRR